MAAPASNKCEKCFNPIPSGAATCPECGAPVGNASTAETEADVYPELAKANLARMRGDYKQAEDQLLSVLKRYPNNPSANEMLGDLAAERDDNAHAIEWYEMALEIVPTSASIARKLRDARSRVEQKQTEDTTAQLGLPDPSSRMPLVVGGLILVFVAIFAGAYYLGARGAANPKTTPVLKLNAQAPQQAPEVSQKPDQKNTEPTPKAGGVEEDSAMLQSLAGKSADGTAILAVSNDPRSGTLTVSFAESGKDDKVLAARIAKDAFAAFPDANTVTLRGVSQGKVAFMADVTKARMAETLTPEWQQQHASEPDLGIASVLQNVWPNAGSSGTETAPTTGSNPPADTGATTTAGGEH